MKTPDLKEDQIQQFVQDGYLVARNLLHSDIVATTRDELLKALSIDPSDPETWKGKGISADPSILALTVKCRTEEVETIAEQLVGPHFIPNLCHSPYLESQGVSPAIMPGYIPVINFPSPGPMEFQKPASYHIDGMHLATLWPGKHYLIIFAYLTDVAVYGGATTILPRSHRRVFEYWVQSGLPGSTNPPDLNYTDPVPLPGNAGDVIFMHYLTVHSGSPNHSLQIRMGLNTAVMPDPAHPYLRKSGSPQTDWTPLDYSLRTDMFFHPL